MRGRRRPCPLSTPTPRRDPALSCCRYCCCCLFVWPVRCRGSLALSVAGQPFIEPALLDELRVEFWLEPVVSRLATSLSQHWVAALALTVLLQLICPLSKFFSGHAINAAEAGWLTAAIPGCSLAFCAAFTYWYPLQFEREIVRLLNRRIRQGRLRTSGMAPAFAHLAPINAGSTAAAATEPAGAGAEVAQIGAE
eukprot:SAG22_NODE_7045_length_782_cov_1.367496_2_plen_195_part_00